VIFEGGTGTIAARLVQAIRENGGKVLFRQEVKQVNVKQDASNEVITRQGSVYDAGLLVFNLPAWNISCIMGKHAPPRLRRIAKQNVSGWGAFMAYIGVDGSAVPTDLPLHHQVLTGHGLGEGESIFLSISPAWDTTRGPNGGRAITISTHTALPGWWNLFNQNRELYESRKSEYMEKVIQTASKVIPHIREASQVILPGTPVTFERFTRRINGWVGGFPQSNLFQAWGPQLTPTIWMVGDSIFPGQSIAGTALGGLNAAKQIHWELEREYLHSHPREFHPAQPPISA
jgi:phytoene dehydrogenase-like protein